MGNKKFLILLVVILIPILATYGSATIPKLEHYTKTHESVNVPLHSYDTVGNGYTAAAEDHSSDMSPLFFIILALFIGTATRHFLKKSPLPFTITLFVIGLLLGFASRLGLFASINLGNLTLNLAFFGESVNWAGSIDPHIILYVFIPTLLFEAAFALDIHTFKKSVGNGALLAVPGIIIALLLTGATIMGLRYLGLGLEHWTWTVALMLGVIISATDPVAVVSILKELGASKKLGTLIESESLLNDGVAIVIFMVFLTAITGTASETPVLLEFIRVAVGGAFIGVITGIIVINWVRKVFNDALFEITVIIGGAYLSFFVAEHFFHISGILAVVTFGLIMAGAGRTRISPEVGHFLHEFWELAAFIANTLIFIIVGVVIAQKIVFTPTYFLILLVIYISTIAIRALIITIFYPLMKRIGYGVGQKDAVIIWWGGLRGAISLALALIVASETAILPEIRDKVLSLTAGIVILYSLINATTIKSLVEYLGLTRIASAKIVMIANAKKYIHQSTEKAIYKLKDDRFMGGADWDEVKKYLPEKPTGEITENGDSNLHSLDTISETRKRILLKEKASYWRQFSEGLLGPSAVQKLSDDIDVLLDAGGAIPLSQRADLEQFWKTPKYMNRIQAIPYLGKKAERFFFERLAVSYDSARGFVSAQEDIQKLVGSLIISVSAESGEDSPESRNLNTIEDEINENRIQGLTFLRNLKDAFPEIYNAIETRQAIRSTLNHQRHTVNRLLKSGRIEPDEAGKMLKDIEGQMKSLIDSPPKYNLPQVVKILGKNELFKDLDADLLKKVANSFSTNIFSVGEHIFKQGQKGDAIYIIIRGVVKVESDRAVVDLIGPGNVIGEMSYLMNTHRTTTITAEQPVTTLKITGRDLSKLISEYGVLESRLWEIAGSRFAENLLSKVDPYSKWKRNKLKKWVSTGNIEVLNSNEKIELIDKVGILIAGRVYVTDKTKPLDSPAVLYAPVVYACNEVKVFTIDKSG